MRFTSTFKLTAAALLLAASTGLAFAQHHVNHEMVDFKNEAPPCPCPPTLMGGLYIGADVGYNVVTTHRDVDRLGDLRISGNPMLAARGWNGGLFLGYGMYFTDIFYAALEGFGYWSGASESITLTTPFGFVSGNIQSNGSYGLAILPGLKVNNTTLAYFRAGYVWSNIHGNGNYHLNFVPVPPLARNGSTSGNNTISGWEFGLGMETLLIDNWSVRGDWNYISYNSSSNNNNILGDFRPRDINFQVGVVYHINWM